MVDQMIAKLNDHPREQHGFKRAVTGIIHRFEDWLLEEKEGEEFGEDIGERYAVGANLTIQ